MQLKVRMDRRAPWLEVMVNYQKIICMYYVLNVHQEDPVGNAPGGSELKTHLQ